MGEHPDMVMFNQLWARIFEKQWDECFWLDLGFEVEQ